MELLRKRNTATTIYFPMVVRDAQDFATDAEWTPVTGDIQFSVDGATFDNTNTTTPTHEGNGMWSLALLGAEVNGKTTMITIIDIAAKVVEDQAILISTFGDDSSQLSFNVIADHIIRRTFQNACDSADGDAKTGRSLLGAIAKLVNKVAATGGTLTVYEDDDSTSLFAQTTTTDAGADPIVTLDTT